MSQTVPTEANAAPSVDEGANLSSKLNWLRAGVLGANDGIVSTAGIVMGVAGAAADSQTLLIAGLAGLVAGALSMAGGEYVSVSSQRDTERAAVESVKESLAKDPGAALARLSHSWRSKGLSADLADEVARDLHRHDAVGSQTEADFGISAYEQTSPWQAAFASFISFTIGAVIPLVTMVASPASARVVATLIAVILALVLTGSVSSYLGRASVPKGILRNVIVGCLTMALTYAIGHIVGVQL
ncbi:MAG: VIT family protein [Propionibacteriaceae bacterium]|jgi:VIT1/CCC1 family predicted Fe2+/Mn2+ transporter|nr:VIT family protein [Propionibacteriaceae bacterium]